ncbi:phenylalanine--tRNA ligase subunit beta [Texcoconibacillus texcoconensis]|uniref:Phenylalanine--tRNA ligase beta subunit n=1 Tax=Texcoconibacillus texcoconensis TaxID=1095777 RepID=A0A840QMY1_9BACI|nr:phenylalanyl-tRNA synthetase beta chain [Texcoconibacillus texcoconensis]
MLVSYEWLKQYVDIEDLSAEEVAEKLTRSGVEVDFIHDMNKGVTGVVVGHILTCEQHPDADKLSLCTVDIGEEETVQIVCGANNVAEGQYVPVAKVGAVLPGNFKIKKSKLRGETSHGMICSLKELGFEAKVTPKEFADGIYVFPSVIEPGSDAIEYMRLYDKVMELDLTPNRADCLSMLGVAYEMAAILGRDVNLIDESVVRGEEQASDYVSVNVKDDATDACPYYGATMIQNVKIAPSPTWLQTYLMASGVRPVNNVVDVTNFVLIEYGQPLHAFDFNRFGSNEVLVRKAGEGETIVTLDGETRTLSTDHLVITNGQQPVALAGVMGGADSEVQDDTTSILLEAAYFDAPTVRRASRDLGIRSDSSVRFEKGVDPKRVPAAADRAARLIAELAGGTVLQGPVAYDELNVEPKPLDISLQAINRSLGTDLDEDTVEAIFKNLQFAFKGDENGWTVYIPTRRQDIMIEADIIEEVARLYGYDQIPTTLPDVSSTTGGLSVAQSVKRAAKQYLETVGVAEAVTYSLTSPAVDDTFDTVAKGENEARAQVAMPMSEDRSTLRTTVLPHLLEAVRYNRNRQLHNVALYEMSSVFTGESASPSKQPTETRSLAGVFTGLWHENSWQREKKPVDFFVVKGIFEGMIQEMGLTERVTYTAGRHKGMHPGRTATVYLDGENIGYIGQVHPQVEKEWGLKQVYAFECNLSLLIDAASNSEPVRYIPIPRYPAIQRDVALVVDENTTALELKEAIYARSSNLLKDVSLFDVYEGENLAEGKKSLAFSLVYRDPEKTLTDDEVKQEHEQIIAGLETDLGATLRTE